MAEPKFSEAWFAVDTENDRSYIMNSREQAETFARLNGFKQISLTRTWVDRETYEVALDGE